MKDSGFPKEIWEIILEEMDSSTDISNIFQAFPQLKQLIGVSHFSWLIGEIMPWIFTKYLSTEDLHGCRLVSRRWENAISSCLETHPDRLPYKSSRLTKLTTLHFCYGKVPGLKTNAARVLKSGLVDGLSTPVYKNPFPGRYVEIFVEDRGSDGQPCVRELMETTELLGKHGHEIWYIRLVLPYHHSCNQHHNMNTIISLFECLQLLPNLKSMKLEGCLSLPVKLEEIPVNEIFIPFRLETLDLTHLHVGNMDTHHLLISTLVNHNHVQKLGISSANWHKKYRKLFPKLTELHVSPRNVDPVADVHKVLKQLRASKLEKLRIENSTQLNLDKLLKVLAAYKIEILEITGDCADDCCSIPVQENLKLRGIDQTRYTFRDVPPSLQRLRILQSW